METAFCRVPVASIRKEPRHEQELVSQLLFGEAVELLDREGEWLLVRCLYDQYKGWCMRNQLQPVPEALALQQPVYLVGEWAQEVGCGGHSTMRVPYGSVLPGLQAGVLQWNDLQFHYNGTVLAQGAVPYTPAAIRAAAEPFLNTAYLWGGRSVFGVDCSGLVQILFRLLGIVLPRDAADQSRCGEPVGFLQETRCGDLAFFDDADGKIVHVGLLLGPAEILHASGQVRIDRIDHQGILHSQTGERTHRLRLIRRCATAFD